MMGKSVVVLAALVLGLAVTPALAGNIVQNPGFETGTFAGWASGGWGVGSSGSARPFAGTYSAYTGCVGAACLNPATGAYLYQDLATTPGPAYVLTFEYLPDSGTPNELDIYWNGILVQGIVNDLGGQNYHLVTIGNLLATSATTRLQFNGRQDPAWLNIDNVSVDSAVVDSTVPEPAAITLFASGLIALAGLRRFRRR